MKHLSATLILLVVFVVSAFGFTNEVNGTFASASYDTPVFKLWGDYFATAIYNENPLFTNHIISWSRSGSSLGGDAVFQEFKWCSPWWNASPVPILNWELAANDNGGYDSNGLVAAWAQVAVAPEMFWNENGETNEGIPCQPVVHFPFGGIIADVTGGDSGQIVRNNAATNLAAHAGVPAVDMWHRLAPVWVPDQAGARKWGFYAGGHPYPAGHLAMAITTHQALSVNTNYGVDTNVWAFNIDASTVTATTNHCALTGLSRVGNTITGTFRLDRNAMGWDVPDGTITNDARDAFTVMPELGNAFWCLVQVTNLPNGNYQISVDGIVTDTASSSQLAAGRNWFTNYTGPLWTQRILVLAWKRKQAGVNPVTLVAHSVGSGEAIPGVADLVDYQSAAGVNDEIYPLTYTGTNYLNYMSAYVAALRQYDVKIWQASQQTNHSISIAQLPAYPPAPFRP